MKTKKAEEKMALGMTVRDRITKFVGTATARCEFLSGLVRWEVTGSADGKPTQDWQDEDRWVIVHE